MGVTDGETRGEVLRLAEEQAALRRVAELVARESSPGDIFHAVTDEARRVLGSEAVGLLRFDPDETATLIAQSETPWEPPPVGTRFTLDGENLVTSLFRTGSTVRVDDWSGATGAVAAMATVLAVRSAVASPVVVEGRLWGVMVAATSQDQALPAATESRLEQFTGLVATAIANAGARGQLSRLAEEQAALRRIAVLVAQQPSPVEVFTAVTEAVGPLLGADLAAMHVFGGDGLATVVASWSKMEATLPTGTKLPLDGDSAAARIFRTGAPARIDSYTEVEGETAEVARGLRLRTSIGAPILVEGKLWGALMAATRGQEPLPADAESRIAAFTQLVATAVSNAQAREDLQRLADEQAALRRVATLVAQGIAPEDVFRAVAGEVGVLFGSDVAAIVRFEDDGMATVLGDVGGPHAAGKRVALDEGYVVHRVRETSHSARFDADDPSAEHMPSLVRALGIRSSVASPIVVEGRLWGAITAGSAVGPLPANAERRLAEFTELVGTAVANTQANERVITLADEQAALRRVATLVATQARQEDVFTAIVEEVGSVLGLELRLVRYDDDHAVVVAASDGVRKHLLPVGTRLPLGGHNALSNVFRTGAPARIDDYSSATGPIAKAVPGVSGSVATPILVEGRVWGAMLVETVSPETERRLGQFGELMATSIANAEARAEIERLAEEQAALRHVATLVAGSAAASDVFAAVTEEIASVLDADAALLCRADSGGAAVVVGTWGKSTPPVGHRILRGGTNLTTIVLETGQAARIESYDDATGDASELARRQGLRSAVGAPILVEGSLWGLVIAGATGNEPLRTDAEQRLVGFTELVATAISNAAARDELVASRARIVAAGDEARRRIERNLHDGTQQRLIALGLDLQRARAGLSDDHSETHLVLAGVEHDLETILMDLRDLSHGLHPPLLSRLGLGPSLQGLARRSPIPVRLHVDLPERPAAPVETAVYYVVSEALTNAIKHSGASEISVTVSCGETLSASIADDGVGGADSGGGTGLTGLLDRVDALGGRFTFESPPGGGTRISIELPVEPPVGS